MRRAIELTDVHHVVLILQHRRWRHTHTHAHTDKHISLTFSTSSSIIQIQFNEEEDYYFANYIIPQQMLVFVSVQFWMKYSIMFSLI